MLGHMRTANDINPIMPITEEWNNVFGFMDYQVSNLGHIRDWQWNPIDIVIKEDKTYVRLTLDDGPKYYNLSYLVLDSFTVKKPPHFLQEGFGDIIFKNGNNFDNSIENLEWVSAIKA